MVVFECMTLMFSTRVQEHGVHLESAAWIEVCSPTGSANIPSELSDVIRRSSHSATVIGCNMFIIGREPGQRRYSDVHALDLGKNICKLC